MLSHQVFLIFLWRGGRKIWNTLYVPYMSISESFLNIYQKEVSNKSEVVVAKEMGRLMGCSDDIFLTLGQYYMCFN